MKLTYSAALITPLLLAGCFHFSPKTRTVRRQDIAVPDRTRLTSRFVYTSDGDLEYPPQGMSPELVTDEAILGQSGDQVCVHYTMRTGSNHDAPFGEWDIKLNDEPVFPQQETRGTNSIEVKTERTIVDATMLSGTALGNLSITAPDTAEIQIIERSAWFCPTRPTGTSVSFQLRRTIGTLSVAEGFVWNLL